jgi:hypothetical protein
VFGYKIVESPKSFQAQLGGHQSHMEIRRVNFILYNTKPSNHIFDRTKRKWGDVTTHDVMKGNKTRIQEAYHVVA